MRVTGLNDAAGHRPASLAPRAQGLGTRRAAALVVTVLAYAALLHYSTQVVFAPLFPYLRYRDPEPILYGLSIALGVIASLALPRTFDRGSAVVLWIVHVSAGLPAMWVAQYLDILSPREALVFSVHIAISTVLARVICAVLPPLARRPRRSPTFGGYWITLLGLALATYIVLFVVAGVRPQFDGLLDVYGVRSSFDTTVSTLPILGYMAPLTANVVNPLLFARGLLSRQRLLLVAGLGGQVVLFLVAGQKSVLFSTAFFFGLAFLFRSGKIPTASRFLAIIVGMSIAAYVVDALTHTIYASSVFVRRFLILPGALAAAYVQIFSEHPQTMFADSFLKFLVDPYREGPSPAHVVGLLYMGDSRTSANVSPFGHGYLSAGYPGVYLEAVVLGVLLWGIDQAAAGLPARVRALTVVMPAIAISSASIFTAMLTHGLLALIVALWLAPRPGWERSAASPRRRPGRPRRTTTPETATDLRTHGRK